MPVDLAPSLRGWENHAIFATRSPTAIRNIRPIRLRRKQMPETSRRGTSTTRHTRSLFLLNLLFSRWEQCQRIEDMIDAILSHHLFIRLQMDSQQVESGATLIAAKGNPLPEHATCLLTARNSLVLSCRRSRKGKAKDRTAFDLVLCPNPSTIVLHDGPRY
jgi:hypothetical protein